MQTSTPLRCALAVHCLAAATLADITVGPPGPGACDGSDCDYVAIQNAVDAAAPGDTVWLYRRVDDPLNNGCYDEHIIIDTPDITLQGASTDSALAACIGPSTGGDIVYITADGVRVQDLEISGKVNDGAGGQNDFGAGGRSFGHGVLIEGDDIRDVHISNCTVNYTFGDNVRYVGDQDQDGEGSVVVERCYLHHSDTRRNVHILRGGGSAADRHIVRNNLIHTGQAILINKEVEYATIEYNIIKGWAYYGHLAGGNFPELRDDSHGGGWRYVSNCPSAILADHDRPVALEIRNNLIIGVQKGIVVRQNAAIVNNTIVNPFNLSYYDVAGTADAADIRDHTVGIAVADGFFGTIRNNIVAVTADNRADGLPGQTSPPFYTPGITGTGIAMLAPDAELGDAVISHNNVWGFVDVDGTTPLNFGPAIAADDSNLSVDPLFAQDASDESNGGQAPCHADGNDPDGTRCYELYEDHFFLSTQRAAGSCHANVLPNSAGDIGFVDLPAGAQRTAGPAAFAGLGPCQDKADATNSPAIDAGDGPPGDEPPHHGGVINQGAFGGTERASRSPTLRIVGITLGPGTVRDGQAGASGPGVIQPRLGGLTEVHIEFNRAFHAEAKAFQLRRVPGGAVRDVVVDLEQADAWPYRAVLRLPEGAVTDRWLRVTVLSSRLTDLHADERLDGELQTMTTGPLPSGDGRPGGNARFLVGALLGDVDGSGTVESGFGEPDDQAITDYPGYPGATCDSCPQDLDADGDVDPADRRLCGDRDGRALPTPR